MLGKRTGSWWSLGSSKHVEAKQPPRPQHGTGRRLGFENLEERTLLTAAALDTSFGTSGVVLTSIPASSNDEILGSVEQPNGQIVTVGEATDSTSGLLDIALARYNSDGSLDTTFGTSETAGTSSPNGTALLNVSGGDDVANCVALQSNGDIVVGGYAVVSGIQEFLVARFTSNGVLDSTFGAGNGYVETEIGGTAEISGIAIQSNGQIVVAGYGTGTSNEEFALAHYNTDGTLDTSFGTTGIVLTQVGTGANHATSMALQSNGDIVAGGWTDNSTTSTSAPELALVRYTSSGTLDTTFNSSGIVTADLTGDDVIDAIALQSNGEIVFGGASLVSGNEHFLVGRYNTNGTLDTSFYGTGYEYTVMGEENAVNGITIDQQNRIVAFGTVYDGTNTDFAFAYNSNGSLDTGFNGTGMVTLQPGVGSTLTQGSSVLIDGNDRILAFGTAEDSSSNGDFAMVRLGPTFDLENNTLYIHGTTGSDSLFLAFNGATQFYAIVNGVEKTFNVGTATGQVNSVVYDGGLGSDGVVVVDHYNTDTVTLSPGTLTLTNATIHITTSGAVNQYFYGISADTAQLTDTSGSNSVGMTTAFTVFSGTGFNNQVFGVGNVTATGTAGTTDTAYLYSVSHGTVYLYPTQSMLTTTGISLTADNFSDVLAVSAGDGTDTAELFGANAGSDTFYSTPTGSFLTGATVAGVTFWNSVMGFQKVSAYAEGGSNTAYFYDQAGTTNTFIGTQTYSSMSGTGYSNVANGFTSVLAVGSAGSTDTAYLYDSAGANGFYASADSGYLGSSSNSIAVLNIGTIGSGGSVLLFDQNGGDDYYSLTNPSFSTQFINTAGTWANLA